MHTDHPFTEKQDVFQLPDFAAGPYSVICDFDGTVTIDYRAEGLAVTLDGILRPVADRAAA